MLLSRTRRKAKLALKAFVFDKGNMQELVEERRKHALEDSMGFRGQWDEHRRFQLAFLREHGLVPSNSFSVLYHLSQELLPVYLAQVAKRLKPSGLCFANVNTRLDDSTWLQFPFVKRTIGDYGAAAGGAGLKMRSLGTVESLGFRLHGAERLNEMLEFAKSNGTGP